ncbi:MAG: sigma factor-like helix-turn-helix DNA-binding protein, partial [bacterium]|nr:sigma factor-like helix-turn-helix DNA-binding protein [bacterium]
MAKASFEKVTVELVEQLPSRVKDVLVERFGLDSGAPLTLEAVGRTHQITRERVRQIVEEGLRILREDMRRQKSYERTALAFNRVAETLRQAGLMKREDLLLDLLEARDEANHALFLLTLGDQFYNQRETQDFHPFWALRKDMVEHAKPFHQKLLGFFQKRKAPVSDADLERVHGKEMLSYLEVSKHILKSHDGRWGLRTWPEVNPRGMRDKAYLVLREEGRPLHFTQVASLIARLQENLALQRAKPVLPQTVHNELIKDPRFVLIGRGTYGLSDWGLESGTV